MTQAEFDAWCEGGFELGYTLAEMNEFACLCVRPEEFLGWTLEDHYWRDGEE